MQYIPADKTEPKNNGSIKLYSPADFNAMQKAGQLVATCLDEINQLMQPNTSTMDIENFIFNFAIANNAIPATLNYRGYGFASCISVNHVVCHGMPSERTLKDGDILNVDITFILDGWHGDSSRIYFVGTPPRAAQRLTEVAHQCLMLGIEQAKPGNTINEIGEAIETFARENRCSVVEEFCGHGIGKLFHDQPNILHFANETDVREIKEGMIFTIEPMINLGKKYTKILSDSWTAVTRDRSLSAQFEHTIGITKNGAQIFTLSPKDIFMPKIS